MIKSSIAKKVVMAMSGFFLLIFLIQHFFINITSVISAETFNEISHFMGTNVFIQFIMQPILIFGVILHLVMGVILELQNRKARPVKYHMNSPSKNSNWFSRNMIITGIMILLFLGLHFYDFWIPEIQVKYINGDMSGLIDGTEEGGYRYFQELRHKFLDPYRVAIYCASFVFLAMHLLHGFQSSFQTIGANYKQHTSAIKKLGLIYAILIPAGFVFIALFHFFTQI